MENLLGNSLFFGLFITVGAYLAGMWARKKTRLQAFNPLLVAIVLVMVFLRVTHISYQRYQEGAKYVSYFLTPATVCLAIPLYKQLHLLKNHAKAVVLGILSGVAASTITVFAMSWLFGLNHQHYVTLLPKSITTAIGMDISQEAGGIVAITVASIVVTGILGSVIADLVFRLARINHPVARGLALGTSAHAIGTAKALELGEVEGAMSSLAIAVAGLMTVLAVPLAAGWIKT